MSFKRNSMEEDGDDDSQVYQKRQRFGDNDGNFRSRGRGRGRGRGGDRGRGGFRGGRGGFNKFGDNEGGGFRGRGGNRGGGFRRGNNGGFRGRGGYGNDRGRGNRGRGGFGGDRSNFPQKESLLKVGQDAPSFENILNDKSKKVSLSQFKGKYVILFIYFKDGTFGCSTEQKAFNDLKEEFDKYNAVILGASRDNENTHKSTVEEQQLKYSLLADTDSQICKAYGALDERDRVDRSTFIISPEGKVVAQWPKIFGFENHPKEVLTKLEEIINGKSTKKDKNENDGEDEDDEENADQDEQDEQEEDDDDAQEEEDQDQDEDDEDDDE